MRHANVIEFGRGRLRALWGELRGGRGGLLRVRRTLVEKMPSDLPQHDAERVGSWLGEQLRAAGFPRGKAIIVIGREQVAFKRMTLPTADDAELPDMVRLAILRELPLDAETAVIDFVPTERDDTSTTVIAAAISPRTLQQVQAVAAAAGLTAEHITLRVLGVAVLLRSRNITSHNETEHAIAAADDERSALLNENQSDRREVDAEASDRKKEHADADAHDSCVLAIDVLGESIELSTISNGAIEFSRSGEVPQPQDELAVADAVVTETRRTWMSYRVQPDAVEVKEAVIFGDHRACAYAADPVATVIEAPVTVFEQNARVETGSHEMDRVWPLAGIALLACRGESMIDFADPRRAPDLAARNRQRRLIAAGIALVALLAGWTMARRQLNALRLRADDLARQQANLTHDNVRYWRDEYKLEHLKSWESSNIDWLEHATYLTTIAPQPDKLVLDSWTGTLDYHEVTFDKQKIKWGADQQLTIVLDGEAKDRETADAFRAALVQSTMYKTGTPGSDAKGGKRMPFGFTYRLRTDVGTPLGVMAKSTSKTPGASQDKSRDQTRDQSKNQSQELAGRTGS